MIHILRLIKNFFEKIKTSCFWNKFDLYKYSVSNYEDIYYNVKFKFLIYG